MSKFWTKFILIHFKVSTPPCSCSWLLSVSYIRVQSEQERLQSIWTACLRSSSCSCFFSSPSKLKQPQADHDIIQARPRFVQSEGTVQFFYRYWRRKPHIVRIMLMPRLPVGIDKIDWDILREKWGFWEWDHRYRYHDGPGSGIPIGLNRFSATSSSDPLTRT